MDVLELIAKQINPDTTDDLIVKNLLQWLKNDMEKVCNLYNRQKTGVTVE